MFNCKSEKKNRYIIFLMGPTSSGKTSFAIELYQKFPVEIISVDSASIYRDMDIGTFKPNKEELLLAPHHLINIRDVNESYSVANFYVDALEKINNIINNGRIPLLVGGTMFYFKILLTGLSSMPSTNIKIRQKIIYDAKYEQWKSLHWKLKQIDPEISVFIHHNDIKRILRALEIIYISGKTVTEIRRKNRVLLPYNVYNFVLSPLKRSLLFNRIENRFYNILDNGFEEEVKKLFNREDLSEKTPSMCCIGYKQMWSYLSGKIKYDKMIYNSIYATKQFAKHQITWLRSWNNVIWLDSNNFIESINVVKNTLNK